MRGTREGIVTPRGRRGLARGTWNRGSYETVRRWGNHFGPLIARDLRKRRPRHLDEVYLKIDGRMAYASGFRDQCARARPMMAARRRTWGRLAAWAGLDLGDDIAGEVLRCPALGAERVDARSCWPVTSSPNPKCNFADRPAPPDLAGAAAAQNAPPTALGKRTRRSEDLFGLNH